mmetsp:Transcript_73456/g.224663  ORF Transcript_73456/g.224663 Transcript_73456/m.224663 type:complete len:257 (-) Transcript_73456:891-1661(-)
MLHEAGLALQGLRVRGGHGHHVLGWHFVRRDRLECPRCVSVLRRPAAFPGQQSVRQRRQGPVHGCRDGRGHDCRARGAGMGGGVPRGRRAEGHPAFREGEGPRGRHGRLPRRRGGPQNFAHAGVGVDRLPHETRGHIHHCGVHRGHVGPERWQARICPDPRAERLLQRLPGVPHGHHRGRHAAGAHLTDRAREHQPGFGQGGDAGRPGGGVHPGDGPGRPAGGGAVRRGVFHRREALGFQRRKFIRRSKRVGRAAE